MLADLIARLEALADKEEYGIPVDADAVMNELPRILALLRAGGDGLVKACNEVRDELSWQSDDEADPSNATPSDMTAHINGLCRQRLDAALREWDEAAR